MRICIDAIKSELRCITLKMVNYKDDRSASIFVQIMIYVFPSVLCYSIFDSFNVLLANFSLCKFCSFNNVFDTIGHQHILLVNSAEKYFYCYLIYGYVAVFRQLRIHTRQ